MSRLLDADISYEAKSGVKKHWLYFNGSVYASPTRHNLMDYFLDTIMFAPAYSPETILYSEIVHLAAFAWEQHSAEVVSGLGPWYATSPDIKQSWMREILRQHMGWTTPEDQTNDLMESLGEGWDK